MSSTRLTFPTEGGDYAPLSAAAERLWSILFVIACVRATVPDLLDTIGRGYRLFDLSAGAAIGRAPEATLAGQVLDIGLVTIAAFRLLDLAVRDELRLPGVAGRWLLAALAVAYTAHVVLQLDPSRAVVVYGTVALGLLISPPPAARVLHIFGVVGLWSLVLSWTFATANPSLGWLDAGAGESRLSVVADQRLAGVFSHPNMLAYWATAVLCTTLMSRTLPLRWMTFALAALTVVACGSRTAAITALLLLPIWAARGPASRWLRGLVAGGLLLAVFLPAHQAVNVIASQGREDIWSVARRIWPSSALLGQGLDYWQTGRAQLAGFPPFAYHAHNQALDLLMLGGLTLTVTVGAYLASHALAVARWTRDSDLPLPAMSLALLCTAITEVPIQFLLIDPRFIVMVVATIAITPAGRHLTFETPAHSPPGRPRSHR